MAESRAAAKQQSPVSPELPAGPGAEEKRTGNARPATNPPGKKSTPLLVYLGTALLSLVIVWFVMDLWRADFNIPFAYEWKDLKQGGEALDPVGGNDALLFGAFFKGMRENGWYLHNPALGAPGALDFHDYPFADTFHFLTIKVLEWVTPNPAFTVNLFFLLGFPLTALSALIVLRQFRVSYPLAVVGSLLFTFQPYHFLRGEQHIWLSSYYTVPLMILVVFWAMEGDTLFRFAPGRKLPSGLTRKGLAALCITVLLGSTGVYYALFGVFFLAVGCLLRRLNWKVVFTSGAIVAALFVTMLLNVLPTFIYVAQHGKNAEVANHYGAQAEFFALRITQMLLPVVQHRIDAFARFTSNYCNNAPFITENATACLGLVASAGFLLLLAWQLGLRWKTARESTLTTLSAMSLCAVLLATMGGFNSLLAFGVSPAIRCYNRFSIFIAFFAVFAIVLLLEKLRERGADSPERRFGWGLGLSVLLWLGLADQTTPFFVPPYAQNAASWQNDKDFVQRIEAKVPAGSMIFQLPSVPFPEGPPGSMSLLRGYLHSKSLRWSFGAMTGRETDLWMKKEVLADGNLERIIRVVSDAGFKGIYIDRPLLSNHEKVEEWLKQKVDSSPLESENGRLAFYTLSKPPQAVGP